MRLFLTNSYHFEPIFRRKIGGESPARETVRQRNMLGRSHMSGSCNILGKKMTPGREVVLGTPGGR